MFKVIFWSMNEVNINVPERYIITCLCVNQSHVYTYTVACRGGGARGGHGPWAQALEGAPAQLVGANFKSRGNFNLAKVAYTMGPALPMH